MPRKWKAVLVGCGSMSQTWLTALRDLDNVEIVGLVDRVEEAAQTRAAQFGLPAATIGTDLAAVLDRTAPDMVFDVTVPEAHAGVTLTALAHGCHVLGEKPMADFPRRRGPDGRRRPGRREDLRRNAKSPLRCPGAALPRVLGRRAPSAL